MSGSVEQFRRSLLRASDRVKKQNKGTVNQLSVDGSIDSDEAYRTDILLKMRNHIHKMKE